MLLGLAAAGLTAALGCSADELFGKGPGAEAQVTTPSGVQAGLVTVPYTLESDDVSEADVKVTYSQGGGAFHEATAGPGGSGTNNLSVSPAGDPHTFVWDSGADLEEGRFSDVVVRVEPADGQSDSSSPFRLHNARYVAAVENRSAGRLRFYELDVIEGDVSFIRSFDTGGTDPFDVIFDRGYYFVAHETTNDVAVFQLDEANRTLIAVEGTPFSAGGNSAKYLASDGSRIFVSNPGGGTISILNLDSTSGKLTENIHSGVAAAGCRSMVARSGRLYVASETGASILIFDVASDGELFENAASPVTTGGLADPNSLVTAGTRLFAANVTSATICGFNFQGDGSLAVIAGSPFAVSGAGAEQMVRNNSKLFAVTGAGGQLLTLTIDAFGALSEDAGSPRLLGSPSRGLVTGASVVLAATTTSQTLLSWTIDSAGLVSAAAKSFDANAEILRVYISD